MLSTQLRSCRRGAAAMLLTITLVPAVGFAQGWDVAAMAGVGIPFGDLGDVANPGFSASLSTTRWMSPSWGIRVGGAGDFLGSEIDNGPSLKLWHYNGGLEFDVLRATAQTMKWHVNVGVGATTTQVEDLADETDFTVNAGTVLEYPVNEYLRIIGGPSLYVIFAEDDPLYVLPITAGIRYLFSVN